MASNEISPELTDDDKLHIMEVFHDDVVPRLLRMGARIGNLCCEFAGEKYRHWTLAFRSSQWGFDIVDFEFDPDARGIDLAPKVARTPQPSRSHAGAWEREARKSKEPAQGRQALKPGPGGF